MAVLKSPRNSRNKNIWARAYVKSSKTSNYQIMTRKDIKAAHKLHLFLENSAHWTSNVKITNADKLPEPRQTEELPIRPNQFMVYGNKRFDSTRPSPLLFKNHLRKSLHKIRFYHLLNSSKF